MEQCKREHKVSKDFMVALYTRDLAKIKTFLSEQNKGANLITGSSRTVLLMDATDSMVSLLSAAKETVCTMFERASVVLTEKGLLNNAFQMQFVVYRDYDCKEDGLLQSSSWETKPNNLRSFMAKITGTGGGEPYWSKTKFRTPTHLTEQLQKLKDQKLPVHAFYLHNGAKTNFEKIASETLGRCEQLNIQSSQGAELLTNFVTEEVLRITADEQGNAAVELYRAKYVNKTFTF